LSKASVILFGSCINKRHFAIDTVFVVADEGIVHNSSDFKTTVWKKVPRGYRDVTLSAWYPRHLKTGQSCLPTKSRQSFRPYRGATKDKPVEGIFSFFPCRAAEESPRGFERPVIELEEITDTQPMGKRLNRRTSLSRAVELWQKVVDQVQSNKLWLGVHAEMPDGG
jgi:hypothetical protein